jgi:CRP-like cAMP-binding protein
MITNQVTHRPAFNNQILSALSADDIGPLYPDLTGVSLASQQILYEQGTLLTDVYFMEAGIASLTADTVDDGHVEVGLTGREGFVGCSVLLNPQAIAFHRFFVRVTGSAYRMTSERLRIAISQSATLRDNCLRYIDVLMMQTGQVAACNARHSLPERLARWLLMTRDRVDDDRLPVTQEFLSIMLGVRRAGVSLATSHLQAAGLVHQARGHLTILDHAGLEAASCDCYRIIQRGHDTVFGRSEN